MVDDASRRKAFSALAGNVDTPEQLGVTLMKAILASALKTKITSEDGKALLVPIDIAITPILDAHARDGVEVEECHTRCFKILGHDIICHKVCIRTQEADERHAELSDAKLLARVKSGPALVDATDFDTALSKGAISAASASEAGIILSNALLTMLADGTVPINDDGTARIEAVATIALGKKTTSKRCSYSTIQILGYDVLTLETCDDSTVTITP